MTREEQNQAQALDLEAQQQMLEERRRWEEEEAGTLEYISWCKTITDGWLNQLIDNAVVQHG